MVSQENSPPISVKSLGYINDEVRSWLYLIDRLQAVGIEKELPIPQIAEMGESERSVFWEKLRS